jgi:hypothetical protein
MLTIPGGIVKRSPAILQREEMRGRDGNQREGREGSNEEGREGRRKRLKGEGGRGKGN